MKKIDVEVASDHRPEREYSFGVASECGNSAADDLPDRISVASSRASAASSGRACSSSSSAVSLACRSRKEANSMMPSRVSCEINGQAMADMLNEALDTYSFSPFVTIGSGDLIVTRDR